LPLKGLYYACLNASTVLYIHANCREKCFCSSSKRNSKEPSPASYRKDRTDSNGNLQQLTVQDAINKFEHQGSLSTLFLPIFYSYGFSFFALNLFTNIAISILLIYYHFNAGAKRWYEVYLVIFFGI